MCVLACSSMSRGGGGGGGGCDVTAGDKRWGSLGVAYAGRRTEEEEEEEDQV